MESASSNAALMRRIVQLESERDDLRRDVETLCMQQSGQQSVASALMAPLQARRLAGLEQELESSKQKISMYKRENANLQDELSEVYHIKAQVSELCKTETEKNNKLEEDLRFYQSKVSASMAERDKLLLEMEKLQSNEQTFQNQLKDSRRLNKQTQQENERLERALEEMTNSFNSLTSEVETYHQAIKKFWRLRGSSEAPNCLEMADSLISDPDESWTFGNSAETSKLFEQKVQSLESASACLKKELDASRVESAKLQQEISNEIRRTEEATLRALDFQAQQLQTETTVLSSVEALQQLHTGLREDVCKTLMQEMKFFEAARSSFDELAEKLKRYESSVSAAGSQVISDSSDTATSSSETNRSTEPSVSREAFVQALQDKVSALMLLSQEEERRHLDVVTSGALEYQLKELHQNLSQVTREKVEALMEVAQLKYSLQELKDRERELLRLLENPSSGGRLLPASWAGPAEAPRAVDVKKPSKKSFSGSYLKSWLRGGDQDGDQSENKASQTDSDNSIARARSRVENAALQERLTSLQQLVRTAKRLQSTLASADGSNSDSLMNSLSVVNGAFEEARRLKAAVSCCNLPVSWSGEEDDSSTKNSSQGVDDKAVFELVSTAGVALVELVLATADLQRQCLTSRLTP